MLKFLLLAVFVCFQLGVQNAEPTRKRKSNRVINTYDLDIKNESYATARIKTSDLQNLKENEYVVIQLMVGGIAVDQALGTTGQTGSGTASWVIKNSTKKTQAEGPLSQAGSNTSSGIDPVIIVVFAVVLALVIVGLVVIIILFLRSENKRKQEKLKWEMEKSVLSGVEKPSDSTPSAEGTTDEEMLPIDENGEIMKATQKAQARDDLMIIMQGSGNKGRKMQQKEAPGTKDLKRTPSPSANSTNSQTPLLSAPKENVEAYPWPQMEPPAGEPSLSEGKKKKKKKKKGKDAEDVMPSMTGEGLSLDVLNSLTLNELALAPTDPGAAELPAEVLSMAGEDPEGGELKKKKKKKKKKAAAEEAE